jgi:uncharacterized Zn-finger protein
MDFSSSNSLTTFAFALDGPVPLPLLVSNDSPASTETASSTDFPWSPDNFYSVIEMNKLLDEMQHQAVSDCSAASPTSPVSTGSSSFYCCQWIGCMCPVYTSLDTLVAHVMQDHVQSGKSSYVCGWAECSREGRPFVKRHKIMTHIRSHTGERPFACDACGKRFARHDSLITHSKLHAKKRAYMCPHAGCGQSFGQVHLLENHERINHTGQPVMDASMQQLSTMQFEPAADLDWTQLLSMGDCYNVLNFY